MKLKKVKSIQDCERFCEGVINDFRDGVSSEGKTMRALYKYTIHLHKMFEKNILRKAPDTMKIVYIAHPISGSTLKYIDNLNKIKSICRAINLDHEDVVPFAPYWLDCHALDDDNPKERARGIKNDVALLERGFVDEVWLFGEVISKGMSNEIKIAFKKNIPIIPMSEGTKLGFKSYKK